MMHLLAPHQRPTFYLPHHPTIPPSHADAFQVLFYEAAEPVENLRKQFPLYAHHFGDWSEHTNAMHQFALWTALEAEGFGANLQHYNPLIDQKAADHWNIPLEWKLRSQLVFGGRAGEPGEKQFQKVQGERLFVHGAKQ
jgi:predicted oxidoreductase (fatty acid repression mutant protein)